MRLTLISAATLVAGFFGLSNAELFQYGTYEAIKNRIEKLGRDYPDFVTVTTAQEQYGIPSPGQCGSAPCLTHIVQVTNKALLNKDTPEVLISGEHHGNERTGPGITIEMMTYMLENYDSNPWIKRLIDTRSIYVMPMTNAQGYFRNTREESGYDPNRDYPNDSPTRGCMNTITARAVNELCREHLFQISVSYHGGIQLIGYMWGASSFSQQTISPDDIAQRSLGSILSATAGAFDEGLYPHGRINDELYSVRGAFEVWAYAANEYPNPSGPCAGTGAGLSRYPDAKTQYEDPQISQINILIETARNKIPSESTLGGDDEILRTEGAADGHFTRNVRIGLAIIEMAQPYLQWTEKAASTNSISVKPGAKLPLSYEVGGSVYVEETQLVWGAIPSGTDLSKEGLGLTPAELRTLMSSGNVQTSQKFSGLTRWGGGGLFGSSASAGSKDVAITAGTTELVKDGMLHDRKLNPFIPAWEGDMVAPTTPGEYFVMARAKVDPDWARPTNPQVLSKLPFSHLVHARTNKDYLKELNGHRIVGREYFYSTPIRIVVSNSAPEVEVKPECADKSPTNVEFKGEIASCSTLEPFCSDYEFVRRACPVTCNACDTIDKDPSPAGSRPGCRDIGGLIPESGSGTISCSNARQYCEKFTFVKERCASSCGYCNAAVRCADTTSPDVTITDKGLSTEVDPDGPVMTCEQLKESGNCGFASVRNSCPRSCGVCAQRAEFLAGYQLSPIIPQLYQPGGSATQPPSSGPPATNSPTNDGGNGPECDCRGGSGTYDNCVFYQQFNNNVCLIAYEGNSNSPPPCEAPPGGRYAYSNNRQSWYVVGCTIEGVFGEGSGPAGRANSPNDGGLLHDSPNIEVYVLGGFAGLVGVAAVGMAYRVHSRSEEFSTEADTLPAVTVPAWEDNLTVAKEFDPKDI